MPMTTFVRPNNGSWIRVNEDKYLVGLRKKHATITICWLWVVNLSRVKERIGVISFDCKVRVTIVFVHDYRKVVEKIFSPFSLYIK